MEAALSDALVASPPDGAGDEPEPWRVIAALGKRTDGEATERLIDHLGHPDPLIRWEAAQCLSRIAKVLRDRASKGLPIWNKQESVLTYSGLLQQVAQALHDENPLRRAAAADALALWNHEQAAACLLSAIGDEEPLVRVGVISALGKLYHEPAVSEISSALEDPSLWVRRAAADALGAIASPRAVGPLAKALGDPVPLVRASVVNSLGHIGTRQVRRTLEGCLQDEAAEVRWYAIRALSRIGNSSSWIRLQELSLLSGQEETLFGRTIAEMAQAAIAEIEAREQGPLSQLRRFLFRLRKRSSRRK